MAKFMEDCSTLQIARYEQVYLMAWDALSDSILYAELSLLDQQLIKFPKRLALVKGVIRIKAQRSLLEAKRQSFRANLAAIKPPKKAALEKAQAFAAQIDVMIKNGDAAVQVIVVADQALTLFNSVQAV